MENGATFAGVPNNFNYNKSGGQDTSPMGGTSVSKVVPDAPASNPDNSVTNPSNPNNPKLAEGQSPLDKFKGLYDNSPKLDANGKPIPAPVVERTVLDATYKDFATAAEEMDFTPDITPEQQAMLDKGGADAMKVTLELMNKTARNAFSRAGTTATHVGKKTSELTQQQLEKQIRTNIVLSTANSAIAERNPVLASPDFAPVVSNVQKQIMTKYPEISPTELTDMVIDYFSSMSGTKSANSAESNTQDDAPNIGSFFEGM